MFGLAIMSMCFLLATLFSKSKTASFLGPMVFFGVFFPYYAVNDPQFSTGVKIAVSLVRLTYIIYMCLSVCVYLSLSISIYLPPSLPPTLFLTLSPLAISVVLASSLSCLGACVWTSVVSLTWLCHYLKRSSVYHFNFPAATTYISYFFTR